MNNDQFITIIKKVVRDSAIQDTIANLEDPPGRGVPKTEKVRSDWFNSLTCDDRNKVESIIKDSVDEALFGLFSVIDGARSIEDGESKGRLILTYKNQYENILNDPAAIGLHDLYNSR
jgi:hypothetical protein